MTQNNEDNINPDVQSNTPSERLDENRLGARILQGLSDMCYIWAKEVRSVFADEGVLIFCVIVPLLYPLLYSWIYNNEVVRDVPVALVDLSHSSTSREFIRNVDASPDTKVAYYCNNLEEAKELIARQKAHGIIYFPSNFATTLYRGEQTQVGVYCDMSLMLTYKAIYQTCQAVASHINTKIQIEQSKSFTQRDEEINTKPLDFDEVPIFNSTGGYGNAIIPAVLILIIQQTLLLGIGLSAGTARENNRYKDLVPISQHYNGIFRIVLGKALCYFLIYIVISAYIVMCVPRFFNYTALATAPALIGLMVPFILASCFFGMTMSCLVRYRENVMLLVIFTSIPLLFLTGVSWPESNIPGIWKGVAMLFPSTFGVKGFLRINGMGATLSDILPEYQALWIQVVAYFIATCLVYRAQLNQTKRHAYDRLDNLKRKAQEMKKKREITVTAQETE